MMKIKANYKQSALIRLRPIFITNINSLAGLLPLALTMRDGTEMLKPMAIVVIGGVLFGLLLVFIFLPVTYLIIYGKKKKILTPQI